MYSRGPPIASGYRGSEKNATMEDYIHMNHNITTRTSNTTFRYNTNFDRTTRVATNTTNNLRSYFTPVGQASQGKGSHDNKGHGRDKYASARSRHSHRGSTWADSKASHKFRAQSTKFNTGTKSFRECSRPSASQLMASIHKESRSAKLRNNRSQLAAFAYQISIHEQSAQNQILQQLGDFMRTPGYGQAPRVKPEDCIRLTIENFNSLGIFTKGTKINSLNKLCRQFNTDILAGCETQADWRQATDEQQFRNIICVSMETRSVVAHNINERMQRNQHGGCAMMAMGRFFAEVVESDVNLYGLGHWCWLKVGSGDKKTRIVMAYQPSGSKSSNSAGTTVREQHER